MAAEEQTGGGTRRSSTGRDGSTSDASDPQPARDRRAVLAFVERYASVLVDFGFPRMPARAFVALLSTDSGRLAAAELAELLQVSPAAISGAMRWLVQLNLASREREPGSRRHVYRVHDDVWYEASMRRDQMLARWDSTLREGIEVLGPGTAAGRRMAESMAYVEFLQEELPTLLDNWRKRRAELRASWDEA